MGASVQSDIVSEALGTDLGLLWYLIPSQPWHSLSRLNALATTVSAKVKNCACSGTGNTVNHLQMRVLQRFLKAVAGSSCGGRCQERTAVLSPRALRSVRSHCRYSKSSMAWRRSRVTYLRRGGTVHRHSVPAGCAGRRRAMPLAHIHTEP